MNALKVLIAELFDYAGMFPPASLSFDQGISELNQIDAKLRFPGLKDADYVVQWKHLSAISPVALREKGFKKNKFQIALLGSAIDDDFERFLDELREAAEWSSSAGDRELSISIKAFEIKCAGSPRALVKFLLTRREDLEEISAVWTGDIFIESNMLLRVSESERVEVIRDIRELNAILDGLTFGIKIRGSDSGELKGVSNHELAKLIEIVRSSPIPLKATAGFHHPIIERDRYGNELGFLNAITALIFASADETFSEHNILECLLTEDRSLYSFNDGLRWGPFHLPTSSLRKLKERVFFRIGSCSLEEPDQDLRRIFPDAG